MSFSIFPNLPKQIAVQIYVFLFLFFFTGLALVYGWLGAVFHYSNGTILLVCLFTILYNEDARVFFLHSYLLILSVILDIFTIAFNWNFNAKFWQFYFGFAFAILMMIAKIFLFIHQMQIAKSLNGEEGLPVNMPDFLANTSKPSPKPVRKNNDIEPTVQTVTVNESKSADTL